LSNDDFKNMTLKAKIDYEVDMLSETRKLFTKLAQQNDYYHHHIAAISEQINVLLNLWHGIDTNEIWLKRYNEELTACDLNSKTED